MNKVNDEITYILNEYSTKYNLLPNVKDGTITLTIGKSRASGEIDYKGKSKIICIMDIIDILDLLHKDYHDLGVTVNFVKSKLHSTLKTLNPFDTTHFLDFKNIRLSNDCNGYYSIDTNKIFINDYHFTDESYDKEGVKLLYIITLIHEIRHAWQKKYTKYFDHKYIDINSKGYLSQPCERDANKFAMRFMNKYKKEISEILRIDGDWYVNYKQVILK